MLWIFVQHCGPKKDFAVVELMPPEEGTSGNEQTRKNTHYTFASGNMLLGLEALGKFQQMADVGDRVQKILGSFDWMRKVIKSRILKNVLGWR